MGAGLLAVLLPMTWGFLISSLSMRKRASRNWRWLIYIIPATVTLLAIVKTKASVPWGVFGTATASFLVSRSRKPTIACLGTVTIALCLIALGQRLLGPTFWDNNQRFDIWRMAWDWFQMHAYPSVGQGYGVFQVLLPLEQLVTGHLGNDAFLWLHNDWLQLGFEGGYVGMFCVYLALGRVLTLAWPRPRCDPYPRKEAVEHVPDRHTRWQLVVAVNAGSRAEVTDHRIKLRPVRERHTQLAF